jgi:hypothetical protein
LSIVISALGSIESLEATLVSVLENRPAACEILVALGGPYSDPYDLKGEVCFVEARRGGCATQQCNQALGMARAPFIHLLSSGCKVTEAWTERALGRFGDRQVGSVVPLVLDADQPERIVAAGVGYQPSGRRYLVGRGETQLSSDVISQAIGPSALAAFYRKSALDQVGGFSPHLGMAQADVDVALRLARMGFTTLLEPQSRVSLGEENADPSGPFRRALYEERLFWRNLPSEGRSQALVAHAGLVTWESACSLARPRMIAQWAARCWAVLSMPSYLRDAALESRALSAGQLKAAKWRIDPAQPTRKLGEVPKTTTPTR